jgi:hypothetical protein
LRFPMGFLLTCFPNLNFLLIFLFDTLTIL